MASTIVLLSLLTIPPVLAADGLPDGPAVAADVRQLMQARDYAAAVAAFDEAVKQEGAPKDELAYLKGRALALAKRYDEAATVLLAIGQQSPESPWARKGRFAAAAALVAKGDFARAQPIYRAEAESLFSLERKQEVAGIYLEFADALFDPPKESDSPDYASAGQLYQKALDLGLLPEKQIEVELRIARCLLEQGGRSLSVAADAYKAFLEDHPQSEHDLETRFRLGESLLALKEYARARQAWRELLVRHAAADSPRIAEVEFRLAETWRIPQPESLRDLVQGTAVLRRFVERHPDHELAAKAHLQVAQSYAHRGKHADAIEALTPFLADPRHEASEEVAEARNLLGQAYQEQKQYDDAIATWQAFLAKHPANPKWSAVQKAIVDMEYARAHEAYEAGRYDEATERWNAFLARYPLDDRSARALFLLGAVDAKQERWDAAVAAWRRLASKHPGRPEARQARLSVAVTLEEKLGRMDEALDEYRKLAESQSYEQEVAQAQGAVARMTSPSLALTTRRVFRGSEKPSVRLSTRNIKSVSVRVYRVDLEAYFRKMHATDGIDTLDIGLIAPDVTFRYEVPEYAKYRRFDNDVELPLPEGQTAGVLAVTVSSKTQEATTLVLQSDLDMIVKSSREGLFVFAQNMATGKPWPEARLLLSDGTKVWAEAATDQHGVFQAAFAELKTADHLQILATAGEHMAASGLDIENVQPPPVPSDQGYLATDRSVYRPGDEVRVRGVLRHVKDGTFHFEPGAAYSLEVYDPNDRRLWHESVALSDLGTFHARVPLPASCAAGEYLLKVEDAQGRQFSRYFAVELLARKPIGLEVDLPRTTFHRGEPIEGTIRATTPYGAPLVRSKVTYRLADEIEQTATTDHRGEVRFQLPTDEFVESQWLVLSANLAEGGGQTKVTLFLSAEDCGLALQTTRDVYMAGETFQVDVHVHDANKQPIGGPFALSVLKRDAKTSDETLVEKHELESDAAGEASQPLTLETGGDYVLRAEAVDRFGNAILAEHRVWVSDAGDDVRLRLLADANETTAGGTLAATVLWHEPPALALITCEGETVLDYRLVPLETGANQIEVPVGPNLAPNFRLVAAVMTGAGAPSSDKEVEHRLFMADAECEVRRELAVDLAISRADGTANAEGLYRPGELLEVTVTTTNAEGKPLPAEVGLALVDGWFRPLGDPALTLPQDVLRPPRRALAMQTGASVEFHYEPGTRPIGTWPTDAGDDSEEEEVPREFMHWAGNRGRVPESLETLIVPARGSSRTRPQPGGGGFFQFGFGPNRDDPFSRPSQRASTRFTEQQRAQTVQFFQPEALRLSSADIAFADTGYWNPTVRTGEDGKATVTIVLPPRRALWQLVAEAVAADTLTGLAERSITADTDLAVEPRMPESFTEGDHATIPVVVYNEAIAEGTILLTLKTTILGQTVEETQTLPVTEKGRLDARLPVTIAIPAGTVAAPPWFEAVFELTVTAGERTAVVRRSVPVLPLGAPMHGTAGGMATGSKAIRASHPADAVAARRSMQLLVSPTLERALLDLVLPPAESAASLRPYHAPASPLETAADALMAAAAMRALVTPETNPADAKALDRRVQTVMGQLVASRQDAGSWTWTGRRGNADLLATARAAWALSLAKQADCSIHEPALDAALDALQAGIADSGETDYDRRAVLLHALAAAGNGNFSLVNRLHRDRAQLSPAALAYLALTFVEMDRNDTAAEVLELLRDLDLDLDKEPAESQAASHRSHSSVELRAICLLVLLKIAPDSPQIDTRAEWLLSQRSSARWQAGGAMGPAVVALARWQAMRAGQREPGGQGDPGEQGEQDEQREQPEREKPLSLALVVNGRELRRLELAADGPTQVVDVPADLLAGESTEVRFLTDAGATYAWQCLLDGYIPLDNAMAATGAQVVRKVCQPAPRMLEGCELPRGFGILVGNYTPFTNPLTQLPVEHRAVVELHVRRLGSSDAAATRREFCVIMDPIPAGTRVLESSITGPVERFEVTPAGIVFHLVHSDRVAVIRYELVAEAEGTYEAGPTLLRHANRGGGQLSAGGSLKLEVLPPGEAGIDPYRFTPEELYALGKHHFGKKEYEQAEQHLRELVDQWNVRPQVYRDAVQMLLDAYLAIGPVAKMVDTFEIVITRWPEKEITFDQLLKIGVAYQEIGEFERGYLVYRGAVEGNLTREGAVAGFLQTQDERLRSIDFMERLLGEYPPEDYAASTLYSLAQHVQAQAAHAEDSAKLRQAGVDGNDLVRRSTALLERFLAEYPENPSADRAAFSVANALLDMEKYEEAAAACARYAERYPKSSLLDSYWYIQGYCQFALGRHDEAAGMFRKVSEYQWTNPKTGRTQESANKWRAVFLLGQIFHSQGRPADAIKEYRRVEDRFADARRSIAYFLRQQIALPELTTLKQGEPAELKLTYRSVPACDVKVYGIDLMKFARLRGSLAGVEQVNLAGIRPRHEETVALDAGLHAADQTHALSLPLTETGAYLVVCRGGNEYASGLVLVAPLRVEVEHVEAESAARVMVRDAASDQVVTGAQVNVIDSITGRSIVGKTDLRGVFVAEEIAGPPTVIVKDEPARYGLYQAPAVAMHAGRRPVAWVQVAPPRGAVGARFGVPLAEGGGEHIRQALAAPISLEFVETPLQDVVDYLKNAAKIEIQIDRKALDDVGVATDMPVTKNLRNVSLKSALRLMLRELGLTYSIADEVLLITTPEEAENRLETRVYRVTDLVRFQDKKGEAWSDVDALIELITSNVKPQTWDEVGGPGSISPLTVGGEEVITLSQTEDVHEELEELLARLRQVGKLPEDGTLPVREPQQWDGPQAAGFGGMGGMGGFGGGMGGGMGGFGGTPADAPRQSAPILQPGAAGKAELLRGLMEAQRELQGEEADQLQQMYEKGKGISGMGGGMF